MSKIDQYNEARRDASTIAEDVSKALGRDRSDNDKHSARCAFTRCAGRLEGRIEGESFSPMLFRVDCSYGYYGSSSGYSATSNALGKYLAKAINERMESLLDRAVELAAVDAEKARKDAEEEARHVLAETAA